MSPLALISVSDKTNIIAFSKVLVEEFGYKILSSGGTAKHLIEAKIPVIKVSEFTNSPEILEGRVKTLHPKIHGGILAKRSNKTHLNDIEKNNIDLIDLVVVNLYPFQKKIEANIPVIKVSDFTNSPEILEGRVKTLHPKIHGGILAKRSNNIHLNDIEKNNIDLIDLVVVNLYPFQQKIEANCSWDEAIENIDIGGPSMIRSAAKNHQDVSVLVNNNQYEKFIRALREGNLTNSYKTELALRAFEHTASYDAAISNWLVKEKNQESNIHLQTFPFIRNGKSPFSQFLNEFLILIIIY